MTAPSIIPIVAIVIILMNTVLAETGQGEDIFKVIMTIFGVDKSKGDMVAIITVNDGEASKPNF